MIKKTVLTLLVTGLVGVLVLGAGIGIAYAQDPDPTPKPDSAFPFSMRGKRGFGGRAPFGRFSQGHEVYQGFLAEELGVSVEELQSAMETARDKAIDQAVAEGALTADQAEQMKAFAALRGYLDKEALMAEALGLSVEELRAAHEDGATLPEIYADQGLEMETFQANLRAAYEKAIDEAVSAGVITQEQADQFSAGWRAFGFRGGRGHRGGMGGSWGIPHPGVASGSDV